jgi:hypothetical protein
MLVLRFGLGLRHVGKTGVGGGGGGGGGTLTTWNPADKSASITLSNGNLTTANLSGSDRQVRATLGRTDTSGQWFFEQHLDQDYTEIGLGIALASSPLDGAPFVAGTNCVIALSNGAFCYNGATSALTTFSSGSYMGLLWDAATDIYKIYKNGTLIFTSGACPLSGTKYPYHNSNGYGGSLEDIATVNFGATPFSFQPTGSTSWDGSRTA